MSETAIKIQSTDPSGSTKTKTINYVNGGTPNATLYDFAAAMNNLTENEMIAAVKVSSITLDPSDTSTRNSTYDSGTTFATNVTVTAATYAELAEEANALTQARDILVDLASEDSAVFNGTASVKAGVSGVLPAAHGGTGETDLSLVEVARAAHATRADSANSATTATSATHATSATTATSATKAAQDSEGNVITETYAKLASPNLTGTPQAVTVEDLDDDSDKIATTAFVAAIIRRLVGTSPAALDTLQELAAALLNDPDYATHVAEQIAAKQDKHAALTSISGLTTAADKMIYTTAANVYATTTLTGLAREILALSTAANIRTKIGALGTTEKAASATSADSATKATNDVDGNPIKTTYLKKADYTAASGSGVAFAKCDTAADTAAKTVTVSGFELSTGASVRVMFTNTNTAESPTLNVSNTGAKAIYYRGYALPAAAIQANSVMDFVYDGTQWQVAGILIWSV